MPRYVLDTNCYLEATHRPAAAAALTEFIGRASPFLYLSSVVAAELLAGTATARDQRVLQEALILPFEQRRRVVTPTAAAWVALGTVLALLVRQEGLVLRQVPRSFMLDVLIAASCREHGAVYVTHNRRDAERIRRVLPFEWATPYPT
jgi:predicted nucleic acid-binding protein